MAKPAAHEIMLNTKIPIIIFPLIFIFSITMIAMPLTYSISNGIALAFVSYALIKIFTGKFSSTSPAIFIIAILSVISFAVA